MNVGNIASVKSMVQETMETTAQTKAEAVKGDAQAMRKLASEQAMSNAQNMQQPANPTTRGLDVKA